MTKNIKVCVQYGMRLEVSETCLDVDAISFLVLMLHFLDMVLIKLPVYCEHIKNKRCD